MNRQKISINDIQKIAEDVRLIKDFTENHNFNSGLINASVLPVAKSKIDVDWPLITALGFTILLICLLAIYSFFGDFSEKAITVLFIVCLVLGGISTMAVHKRFVNSTLTLIAGGVLLTIIAIGCGVFTLKETMSEAKSYFLNQLDKDKK